MGDEGRAATNREREEQLMSMCGNKVKEIRKDTKKAFDTVMFRGYNISAIFSRAHFLSFIETKQLFFPQSLFAFC